MPSLQLDARAISKGVPTFSTCRSTRNLTKCHSSWTRFAYTWLALARLQCLQLIEVTRRSDA